MDQTYDQADVDAAVAEENSRIAAATTAHLQNRVVELNLRVRELEAEVASLRSEDKGDDGSVDVPPFAGPVISVTRDDEPDEAA